MGIVLRLLGSNAWFLFLLAIALTGTHGWAYRSGVVREQDKAARILMQAVARKDAEHAKDLKARTAMEITAATKARAIRESLEQRLVELALLPPQTLIRTVEVTNESGCSVPVPTLGNDFWLRFRAAGERSGETDPPAADPVPSHL